MILTRRGWPTDMIDSSLTRVSTVVALPVSLEAGCVSTLHILISNGALAATTKDPMASIAKGICNRMHSLSRLWSIADKQILFIYAHVARACMSPVHV